METRKMWRWNVGFLLALTLSAGCGGSQAPSAPPAAAMLTGQMATSPLAHFMPAPRPARATPSGHSWMHRPKRVKEMLLYVSDWANNIVNISDYKTGEQVGQLTGFDEPYGQCVDDHGNVFITNYGDGETMEFAHGGTSPLKTFFTNGTPLGCSVDRRGDLAVTSFNPGNVTVFPKGKSTGQNYANTSCNVMWPAGYDDRGNLYVLGEAYEASVRSGSSTVVSVCEVAAGSSTMAVVPLSGASILYPGSVMWDGKHITLTDQGYAGGYQSGVYQTVEDPSGGLTVVGSTNLDGGCYSGYTDIEQPFFVGKKNTPVNLKEGNMLVGVSTSCRSGSSNGVVFWRYPSGGEPFKKYNADTEPLGVSVSIIP
ncbi:MAG TPA: hypothetical protein VGI15_05090 [Candidatus Cybelea sp.]